MLIFAIVNGCEDDPCIKEVLNPEMIIKFSSSDSDKYPAVQVFIKQIDIVGTDTILVKPQVTQQKMGVRLNPFSEESRFIIYFDSIRKISASPPDTLVILNIQDTLSCFYSSEISLLSAECGFINQFILESYQYTQNVIDSIVLITSEINQKNVEESGKEGHIQVHI